MFSHDDVDRAAAEYVQTIGPGEASHVLAALVKAWPPLRGHLPWTAAAVHSYHLRRPPTHHPPMSWPVALGLAAGLRANRHFRDATLLLLQWRLGLRPSEGMRCVGADVTLPTREGCVGVVRLGVRFGTKLRRVQFARGYPNDYATMHLLRRIVACRRAEERVGDSTSTPQFTRRLRAAATRVGLPPLWSAHCPRAGWTTARDLAGQPFGELREDGRWASDSSLRIYIDAVTSIDLSRDPFVRERDPWLKSLEASFYADYVWV